MRWRILIGVLALSYTSLLHAAGYPHNGDFDVYGKLSVGDPGYAGTVQVHIKGSGDTSATSSFQTGNLSSTETMEYNDIGELVLDGAKPVISLNASNSFGLDLDIDNSGLSTNFVYNSGIKLSLANVTIGYGAQADASYGHLFAYGGSSSVARFERLGVQKLLIDADGKVAVGNVPVISQLTVNGGFACKYSEPATTYTMLITDCLIDADSTTAGFTIDLLPLATARDAVNSVSARFQICNVIGANDVTLDGNLTELIDGAETYILAAGTCRWIQPMSTGWRTF